MNVCKIMVFNHVKQRTLGIVCLLFLSFFLSAQIQPATCDAGFSVSYVGMKANFTNTSSGFSQNVIYSWDFGDGNFSSLENPIHTYQVLATYKVKLKVTDQSISKPCTDQVDINLVIDGSTGSASTVGGGGSGGGIGGGGNSAPCQINFTHSASNDTVSFQATTSGGCSSNLSFSWDFDNGMTSNLEDPVIVFSSLSAYNVCLVLDDVDNSTSDSICKIIDLTPPCQSAFTYTGLPNQMGYTNNYKFTDQSTNLTSMADYEWSFGDGDSSKFKSPAHEYYQNGDYEVCLKVSEGACSSTYCDTVSVSGIPYYSISGTVFPDDSIAVPILASVYLFKANNKGTAYQEVDFRMVIPSSYGQYLFNNVPPGEYVLKGSATATNIMDPFIPIYLGGSPYWKQSPKLLIDTMSLVGKDMYMVRKPQKLGGVKVIKGYLKEGQFSRGPSDPMGGIDIGMMNSGGDLVGHAETDSNGFFIIDSVTAGDYSIVPDITGIEVDSFSLYNINVSNNTDSVVMDITADSNNIYGNVSVLVNVHFSDDKLAFMTLYPNPTRGDFVVEVADEIIDDYRLSVYSAEGETVRNYRGSGQARILIDRSGLSNGLYFIEVRMGEKLYRKKVILH